MCELVDFIFQKNQSFMRITEPKPQIKSESRFAPNSRISPIFKKPIQSQESSRTVKYAQICSLWEILLVISDQGHKTSLVFKLLKNGELFRIHTIFLRTHLISFFSKNNQLSFKRHLNPLTGDIFLSIQFLSKDSQQKLPFKQIQFLTKQNSIHKKIIKFWEDVVSMAEGNFGVESNQTARKKATEIKILSLSSEHQNQSENVYNFKTFVNNHPKALTDSLFYLKKFFPQQKDSENQCRDFEYRKSLLQVFKQKKTFQQQSIRPVTSFSNYEVLNLNKKDKQGLFSKIRKLQSQEVIRVDDLKFGKIYLQSVNLGKQNSDDLLRNLSHLNKANEHNFVNYYFVLQEEYKQELLKMALKKAILKDFLEKNAFCLSFQKKLNIFMDVFHVLQQVWDRFRTFPGFFNISDFSITKTHVVKFQNIEKWTKLEEDEQQPISDQKKALYKAEMMVCAQKLFDTMFFSTNLIGSNSTSLSQQTDQSSFASRKVNQKRNSAHFYGFREILSPIMYSFQKYETVINQIRGLGQNYRFEKINLKLRQKIKKGNLDLVFGALYKGMQLLKLIG